MDERKRVSRKQERAGVKRHGGRLQAGSGSGPNQKGDQRTSTELYEYKTVLRGKKQITIKADDLEENIQDAWAIGRTPVFGIRLNNKDYVILEADDYEEMRHA